MSRFQALLQGLGTIVVSSLVLIALALVYFMVTAWIIAFGVDIVIGVEPSADFLALSAAILSIGGLAGSTYSAYSPGSTHASGEDEYADQEVV